MFQAGRLILLFLFITRVSGSAFSQDFVPRCEGQWQGTLYIWANGQVVDSVPVRLTVEPVDSLPEWTWKTEYRSEKMPVVKDYLMARADAYGHQYWLNEGDGVVLPCYAYGNVLYAAFRVEGNMLTSSYTLVGDVLIFEVTSGVQHKKNRKGVKTFSYDFVQRVEFRRVQ